MGNSGIRKVTVSYLFLLTFFLVSLKKDLNINPKKDERREEQGVFDGKGFKTLTEINKAESPDIEATGLFLF